MYMSYIRPISSHNEFLCGSVISASDSPPSSFTANMRLDSGQVEESTTDRSFEAVQSSAQAEREEAVKGKKPGDFLFLGATLCVTIIAVLIQVIAGAGSATRT